MCIIKKWEDGTLTKPAVLAENHLLSIVLAAVWVEYDFVSCFSVGHWRTRELLVPIFLPACVRSMRYKHVPPFSVCVGVRHIPLTAILPQEFLAFYFDKTFVC